ncbi:MAG: SIMPL domain-containing protein [Flavobacteriaceae bacterium]|nr:SIMPL domain-containing protein [Flavobacteriaceae bacterium]
MKKILLLFICFQTVLTAQTGQKNFIDQPYIEVNGNATLEVSPNEIFIAITLQETDKNKKNAIESQEKKLKTKLNAAGINCTKKLTVKDFTSSYKNQFLSKADVRKTKTFELLVSNGEELSTVFTILESLGIANSYIIKVDHSDIENLKLHTNIKAIIDAKNKSVSYTKALGQKTGKAIYIREQAQIIHGNYPQYQNLRQVYKSSLSMEQETTASEFKNIIIKATVLARFIII